LPYCVVVVPDSDLVTIVAHFSPPKKEQAAAKALCFFRRTSGEYIRNSTVLKKG
jgi:hypothetical protein